MKNNIIVLNKKIVQGRNQGISNNILEPNKIKT